MAISIFDVAILPDVAEKAIATLQDAWKAAKGNPKLQDSIHKEAEAIRSQFGYSGGAAGNKFIALATNTVKEAITKVADVVQGENIAGGNASTVSNVTDVLSPTSTAGNPFVQSLPDSANEAIIPEEIKKVALYGGIFVGGIMVLKIMMGGKRK
jgi:hypothetical protein